MPTDWQPALWFDLCLGCGGLAHSWYPVCCKEWWFWLFSLALFLIWHHSWAFWAVWSSYGLRGS